MLQNKTFQQKDLETGYNAQEYFIVTSEAQNQYSLLNIGKLLSLLPAIKARETNIRVPTYPLLIIPKPSQQDNIRKEVQRTTPGFVRCIYYSTKGSGNFCGIFSESYLLISPNFPCQFQRYFKLFLEDRNQPFKINMAVEQCCMLAPYHNLFSSSVR